MNYYLVTETEVERLKQALKLLSESEKQLRVSSERSTWFTATLLQLGCVPSSDPTPLGSGRRQSSRTTDDDMSATFKDIYFQKQKVDTQHYEPQKSTPLKPNHTSSSNSLEDAVLPMRQLINGDDLSVSRHDVINSSILDDIWARCIDKCHSKTLRQLLHTHGNLVSVSEDEGNFKFLCASVYFRGRKRVEWGWVKLVKMDNLYVGLFEKLAARSLREIGMLVNEPTRPAWISL